MKTFTLYILYSQKIDRYYVGYTANLKARLLQHLSNHQGFTGRAKDWTIVFQQHFSSKTLAMDAERQIKRKKSRAYIQFLIQQGQQQ
ncbi:MAG: GIY-YIG nuclease family protein [Bacteroidota bacterium]